MSYSLSLFSFPVYFHFCGLYQFLRRWSNFYGLYQNNEILSKKVQILIVRLFPLRYVISPENDINFAALLVNSKKTRTFTIENKNEKFDLKYVISKPVKLDPNAAAPVVPDRRVSKGLVQILCFWLLRVLF